MLSTLILTTIGFSAVSLQAPGQVWDQRFHLNGLPGASALETYDDGSGPALYAGGVASVDSVPVNGIARWNGQSWGPVGTGLTAGSFAGTVHAMAVFDGGSGMELHVGGSFSRAGSVTANGIARWNGTRWAAVGSGAASTGIQVNALTVFDDGNGPALYAGGIFSSIGGTAARGIARWNGTSWSALGGGFSSFFGNPGIVEALAGFQGMLYAGGEFIAADGAPVNNLARWDGTKWRALGAGAVRQFSTVTHVLTLETCADERGETLVIGGDFDLLGGRPAGGIGRWNGMSFEPIGPGLGQVEAVAQFDDGSGSALYAAGPAFFLPGGLRRSVARWDGRSWRGVGSALESQGNPAVVLDLEVFADGSGKELFIAGGFQFAGERVVSGVAELRDDEWHAPTARGQGIDIDINTMGIEPVAALERWDDGSGEALYAGGSFILAGTTAAERIARWDGAGWSPLGAGIQGFPSDRVLALEVFDGGSGSGLYAGGVFHGAGSVTAPSLARWDGVAWWPLGSGLAAPGLGFRPEVYSLQVFDDGSGPALFVGGAFSRAGGLVVQSLAKWDGTDWSDVGGGVTAFGIGTVHSLAVFDDGSGPALFVGGEFDAAGGTTANGIARWDGTGWSDLGGGVDGFSGRVQALAVFDDGPGAALYAGGQFSMAGGANAFNLARWDGSSWTAVGGGLTSQVFALEVHDDGSGQALYAGGEFNSTVPGQTLRLIGRWDGSTWTSLGSGLQQGFFAGVYALRSFSHDGVPALYAGGTFERAGGFPSWNIARWSDSGRRRAR